MAERKLDRVAKKSQSAPWSVRRGPAARYFSPLKSSNPPARMNGDNPAGKIAVACAGKARRIHHRLEVILFRKFPDAFDQVAIGLAIARDDLADGGNDRE